MNEAMRHEIVQRRQAVHRSGPSPRNWASRVVRCGERWPRAGPA